VFLWLSSVELAIARVANRVRLGGHGVPEEVIRRRYYAGVRNFWRLYQPIATTGRVYDNSQRGVMRLLATGRGAAIRVLDVVGWSQFERQEGE
jgi:predicted ABC-type ATPase